MKRFAVGILLITGFALLAPAAGTEDEIRGAEKAWAEAVKGRDFAALDRIFAPELIYAHSTGAIESKQKYIDRLRAGKQRYEAITQENIKIVPYGDSVVAHSLMRMTGVNDAGPFNDHVMMMHLWVKKGGSWRLAAHQTTKVP
jgi:ketosteroid isomerase-like protein